MNYKHSFQMICVTALLIALSFISIQTVGANPKSVPGWTIADLVWMSGDWQTDPTDRAVSEEHWTRPAGGSMIGMSRTLVGDRTASFEFLRIEARGDAIYYVASPKGRCPATDFKLTRLSGSEAVFENPEHDFPKRIIYRRNSEGGLSASVDGGEGTKSEKFDFKAMAK
jgi:Domain of unknown function (DUF6265)